MICDFSENYSFVIQDAVQSYHWSTPACTLHPFCLYYFENNEIKCCSIIVIAESLEHNAISVYQFQNKLVEFVKNKFEAVSKIIFFSDGAGSQYKNKKNFYNLCQFEKEYGLKAEWHFFATSHGKSPCDALGGAFKRNARKASLQRIVNEITTAKQLYDWAQNIHNSIITYMFCSKEEYAAMKVQHERRYDNVKTIHGTQSYHFFKPIDDKTIETAKFSDSEEKKIYKLVR